MVDKLRVVSLLFIFTLFFTVNILAGGGRFDISTPDNPSTVGDGIEVNVKISTPDSNGSTPSPNEKAAIVIKNPRSGDKCDTQGEQGGKTDSQGVLHGNCYATTAGTYNIYVHSNDKGDDSSEFVLTFNASSTPTVTPASSTTPTGTISTTPSPTPKFDESSSTSYRDNLDEDELDETPTPELTPTEDDNQDESSGNPLGLFIGGLVLAGLGGGGFWYWKKGQKKGIPKLTETEETPAENPSENPPAEGKKEEKPVV